MEAVLTGALVLGFIGSAHCVGMCGPLVLAMPFSVQGPGRRWQGMLAYHGGRIGMYALLGAAFGLIGERLKLAGWQHALSIGAGVLLLLFALATLLPRWFPATKALQGWQKLWQPLMLRLMQRPGTPAMLALGMLNGLLPCGMVYMAIAGALALGGALQGSLFMIAYGLGTLPALLLLSMASWKMDASTRHYLRKAAPYLGMLLAALLIVRGLMPDAAHGLFRHFIRCGH